MDVTVKGRNISVTEALERYAFERSSASASSSTRTAAHPELRSSSSMSNLPSRIPRLPRRPCLSTGRS